MKTGIRQELTVLERTSTGLWVGDDHGRARLDPAPRGFDVGDPIEVFVYNGKEGLLATTTVPAGEVGDFVCLEVVDVNAHGAFLAWGLDRDLIVPFGCQHHTLAEADWVVVRIALDDHGRIYGTSKLGDFLDRNTRDVRIGAEVALMVFDFKEIGTQVLVEERWTGMIYDDQTFQELELGQRLTGYVTSIREDGRLDISLQRVGRAGTLDATERLWQAIEDRGGFLPLTDRSDPDDIRDALQMSKKVFKKAAGALYRERRIRIGTDGLHRAETP